MNFHKNTVAKKQTIFDVDLDELLANADEATDLNTVCRAIVDEANSEIFDQTENRKNEDWSILANQVVGSENR